MLRRPSEEDEIQRIIEECEQLDYGEMKPVPIVEFACLGVFLWVVVGVVSYVAWVLW